MRGAGGSLRLALITGTATALLFWLSTSFWIDAWRQRSDTLLWHRETAVQDALLAAARALAVESLLSDGTGARAVFGLPATEALVEARATTDATLTEAMDRLRELDKAGAAHHGHHDHGSHSSDAPPAGGAAEGSAERLARLHASLRLDRGSADGGKGATRAETLRDALDSLAHDVLDQLAWRPQRARSRDAVVERLQRLRALVQTLAGGLVAEVRAAGDRAVDAAASRLRARDAAHALDDLIGRFGESLGGLDRRIAARVLETSAQVSALLEASAESGANLYGGSLVTAAALVGRERAALAALGRIDALDRQLGEGAHARLGEIERRATRRLLIDSVLLAICVLLVIASVRLLRDLRHRATHDPLTGLADRARFEERLDAALAARPQGDEVAVLLVDLDGFKRVNDTLGHDAGDRLLVEVAARLGAGAAGCEALVGRLGGDEFALFFARRGAGSEAARVAAVLIAALAEPFDLDGHEARVAASVGLAVAPRDGDLGKLLLRRADLAMYGAKGDGGSRVHRFEHCDERRVERHHVLRAGLERALVEGGLELHYQPKVTLDDGRVDGVEALLRWRRPGKGFVAPSEFVPIAERSGLIGVLGDWVLEEACRAAAAWRAADARAPRVAINVSAVQLAGPDFVDGVRDCLRRHRLDPRALEIEITEGVVMNDLDTVVEQLERLRALGLRIAVDDFGTGFSSLRWLDRLPLDCLKIDRSFVERLGEPDPERSLAHKIVVIARSFDLEIVAEGVETDTQLAALAAFGCDYAQGWLFAPAVPSDELGATIARIEAETRTITARRAA